MVGEVSKIVDVLVSVTLIAYFCHVLHMTADKKRKLSRLQVNNRCTVLMFSSIYFQGRTVNHTHLVISIIIAIVWAMLMVANPQTINLGWSLATIVVTVVPLMLIRYKYS